MQQQLDELKSSVLTAISNAASLPALDEVRVGVMGKNGKLTAMMKGLGALSPDERKAMGQLLNVVKEEIATAIETKKADLETAALNAKLATETVDVTLPVRPETHSGRIHPVSQTMEEMLTIFAQMGFELADGPDIEDDWHNFEALNIPQSHPSRQMQATFFMDKTADKVLRTQTSGVQIRTMEKHKLPIKIVAPGRVYRCDYDATHTPMFHQVEGLVIDKNITMAHLKGCLYDFVKAFFELDELPVRYRPSYFPFTEPSAEMDIGCKKSKTELKIGAGTDWLEILGCGMVHPNVLRAGGIDPDEYQGFAFGIGMDRLAMLKYGIPDLRTFFESDVRWLKHYGFLPLDESSMTGGLSNNGGSAR